jgi:adenylate kinase
LLAEETEPPVAIVNVQVDREELVRRIAGRRSCPNCGAVYNVHVQPPRQEGVCDVCGSGLVQRADDREETVRERLAVYDRQTRPLLDYYEGRLRNLDGRGRPEDVFARLLQLVRVVREREKSQSP